MTSTALGRWAICAWLTGLSLLLQGCWDYVRINDRAQLSAIGVDPTDNPSRMRFTFQIPRFDPSGGSEQKSAATVPFQNYTVEDDDFNRAISKAQMSSDKLIFLGNLQTLVINAQLSGENVRKIVTELIRNQVVDKMTNVVATPGQAADVLRTKQPGRAAGDTIDNALRLRRMTLGTTKREQLWQFWRDIEALGLDASVGMVSPDKTGLRLYGMLVFRDAQPHVQLTPDETIGFNLAVGDLENIAIDVNDGTQRFSVTNTHTRGVLSCKWLGHGALLRLETNVEGTLAGDGTDGNDSVDAARLTHSEGLAEKQMRQQIQSTVRKLQREQADAYGFGRMLLIQQPRLKTRLQSDWPKLFSSAQSEIRVRVVLRQTGALV